MNSIRIKDYLETNKPRARKGDGSLYYDCPWCKGKGKLEKDIKSPAWHCHKCKRGGYMRIRRKEMDEERPVKLRDLDEYEPSLEDDIRWKWLRKTRGLSPEIIRSMRPHSGPSLGYVYFPFYPPGGEVPHYFTGRRVVDSEELPVYENPPNGSFPVRKTETLWGLHRIIYPVKNLVLCEGIFDACWEPHRVALLGKTISPEQVSLVNRLEPWEITVMLDGDAAEEAVILCQILSQGFTRAIWKVDLPQDQDPDDLGKAGEGFMLKHRRRIA